jgi:hypothetical protein
VDAKAAAEKTARAMAFLDEPLLRPRANSDAATQVEVAAFHTTR